MVGTDSRLETFIISLKLPLPVYLSFTGSFWEDRLRTSLLDGCYLYDMDYTEKLISEICFWSPKLNTSDCRSVCVE